MGAIVLPMSSAGAAAVSGLDTHVFASTAGLCRFRNRSRRLSNHSVVKEARFSSCPAGNGSAHIAGGGRRRRPVSGNKRRVALRCAASGGIGKGDNDSGGSIEEFNDEAVGASGSGRLPNQKELQVSPLTSVHTHPLSYDLL